MINKADIVFIINSFNRLTLLKECLNVLNAWIPTSGLAERCAAVVFDAGSTDGSVAWLQSEGKQLGFPLELVIPNVGDDTSFSAGLNAGVAHAEAVFPNLNYLLFYETDNQILSELPVRQALVQLQEQADLGACGFTVRRHNGSSAGVGMAFPSPINFALGKNLVHKFKLEAIPYRWVKNTSGVEFSPVDVVFTSPLLVRLDAWKQSQGLDAALFPFSDCDIDWAYRLRKLGWRMGVIRTNDVIHDNLEALSAWSKSRAMQFHRGRSRYFRRHRPVAFYAVWPLLLMRHSVEYLSARLFIKEPVRRDQLSRQFRTLLLSSVKGYK